MHLHLTKNLHHCGKLGDKCLNCMEIAIQPSESRKLKVSSSLPQKAIEQQWLIYKFIQLYSIIKNKRKRYITSYYFFSINKLAAKIKSIER